MSSRQAIMREAKRLLDGYLQLDLFQTQFPTTFLADWLMVRIEHTYVERGTVLDLGGGFAVTNAVLADLGMKVYCVDLMGDYMIHSTLKASMDKQFQFLQGRGVNFIHCDLLKYEFTEFSPGSVDVVCSYHTFEHLHHSPRHLCSHVRRVLKEGGVFFLEVPNALNLLKRIKVLAGRTNYPEYHEYFESDRWVGHVREYSLGDILYLARACGFKRWKVFGLNYYGTLYSKLGYGSIPALVDRCLRFVPGLCSTLYFDAVN